MKETTNTNVRNAVKGTVLVVEVEKVPCRRELVLDNEEFRKIIKGNLEIIKYEDCSAALIFDRDREERNLPLNRAFVNRWNINLLLLGTFIVVGLDEDLNYTSLSWDQLGFFTSRFYLSAKLVTVDGRQEIEFFAAQKSAQ